MEQFAATLELKTVDVGQRLIVGLAAAHNNTDRVRDIIDPGASAKAVARLGAPSDVAVFVGHNSAMLPVGIPQKIEATPAGLYTETYILKGAAGDNLLAVAKDLAEHGQALGMSIGYKTRNSRMERHHTKSVRRLLDYDLKEYSYASQQAIANPMALVSAIKSRKDAAGMQYRVEHDLASDQWLVYGDVDADGDEDDNRLIGTYASQETANAVATALRMQQRADEDSAEATDAGADDADKTQPPSDSQSDAEEDGASVKAQWSSAQVNDLKDSAFLYVEDGDKDEDGKTVPRSKRHFPVRGPDGKLDLPHLRNAIARIPQSDLSDDLKSRLQARARRLLAQAQSGDGKTAPEDEPPEWQSGAALALYGLGGRLQDIAEQLGSELKAMACLGEDTKDYQRMRAPLRDDVRAVARQLGQIADFAETCERGEDGLQRLAWLRQQLALTEV